jgi:hypothetical protein
MQRLRRFAKYWELVGNSGNFLETTPLLWNRASGAIEAEAVPPKASPFAGFMAFSDWVFARIGRTDTIALVRLMQLLFEFLVRERHVDPELAAKALWSDYRRGGRRDKPSFLVEHLRDVAAPEAGMTRPGPKRQSRHAAVIEAEQGDVAH